ncbi:AraC family transcriptional regulator [Shewanella woodyi]|uniref:AraC family transcriptional regulator n=1 Tax=Shewanella woodyi TaxID=60961 RepID=UPI00374934B5
MNETYLIRSAALQGFSDLVKSYHGEPAELLEAVGLSFEELNSKETLISFLAVQKLLELSANKLNVPDFGLALSQGQNIDMLGQLGLLMASCKTLKDVMLSVQRYMSLHSPAENWVFSEVNNLVYITRLEYEANTVPLKQIKELSLGVCFKFLQLFIGQSFTAIRVELSHSPVSELKAYRKIFKVDVQFNQEYDQIIFDKKYLQQVVHLDDQNRNEFLEKYIDSAVSETDYNNLERQIMGLLIQYIGSENASLDNISHKLGMNKRTLQRQLKTQQINFKEILANIRGRKACWYLSASEMSITLIGEALGYKDVSAFSRAFKLLYGTSPSQWRKARGEFKVVPSLKNDGN